MQIASGVPSSSDVLESSKNNRLGIILLKMTERLGESGRVRKSVSCSPLPDSICNQHSGAPVGYVSP